MRMFFNLVWCGAVRCAVVILSFLSFSPYPAVSFMIVSMARTYLTVVYLSVCLSVCCLSFRLSVCLSFCCLSFCLSVCCLSFCSSVCLSVCLSVVYLSVCLSVCLSVVYLSVCLSLLQVSTYHCQIRIFVSTSLSRIQLF